MKTLLPKIRLIGVEAAATDIFSAALRPGRPVTVSRRATLAEGLATLTVEATVFALARGLVDKVAKEDEAAIELTILRSLELEKAVVEGAAATPLAALISGRLPKFTGSARRPSFAGATSIPRSLSGHRKLPRS